MNNIQPLLVPCTGTLADLHVIPDPSDTEKLQVYWGTALLQVLPRDKNSLLFRIVVGLLLNLKFRIGAMAKVFGVSEKTLRVWRDALINGHWHDIAGAFHGPGATAKLRPDVKRYIQVKYREACERHNGSMPYGFRKRLCEKVRTTWPDQDVSEELLRQIFRDQDEAIRASGDGQTANGNGSALNDSECRDGDDSGEYSGADTCSLPSARGDDVNHKHAPGFGDHLSSDRDQNRKQACDCPGLSTELTKDSVVVRETGVVDRDNPDIEADHSVTEVDGSRRGDGLSSFLSDSDRSSSVDADDMHNRKDAPGFGDHPSSDREQNREQACDYSTSSTPVQPPTSKTSAAVRKSDVVAGGQSDMEGDRAAIEGSGNRHRDGFPNIVSTINGSSSADADDMGNGKSDADSGDNPSFDQAPNGSPRPDCESSALPAEPPLPSDEGVETTGIDRGQPNTHYLPILSHDRFPRPFMSQHAGFLLLSPWFDEAFGAMAPILRQTSAQILCGRTNQEQGKLIDYQGFERIVGKVVRDLDRQRTLLDRQVEKNALEKVYVGNARLLKLRTASQLILYGDTYHSEYTGCENAVLAWSGRQKKMLKGLMLEFFHTAGGSPCMIGHYDNFYDGRQRFVLLRTRFKNLLHPWSGTFTWVHDRGYWGYEFLRQLMEWGDHFIQWEKDYRQSAWDDPYEQEGTFVVYRQGNRKNDRRERVEFRWREQKWDRLSGTRRLIVRARKRGGQWIEVAIVTSHPMMPAKEVICLMFDRHLQENDFAYLNRYFGIKELTARKFDRYEAIAEQLQDRPIASRAYKATRKEKQALQEKLRDCLFELDGLPATSLAAIDQQRDRLRRELDQVKTQLINLIPATVPDKTLARMTQRVQSLKEKFESNKQRRHQAEVRLAKDEERRRLHDQLDNLNTKLAEVNKTESRVLMMIEENYVRFNMDRKSLVDALRIGSRNVFCCALQSFRPNYDDFRDDHVVLRALTRAAGVVVPVPRSNHLAVFLLPCLDLQPAQWERVKEFVRCCEKKIEKRFGTSVRFHVGASNERIFDAVEAARHQTVSNNSSSKNRE